MDHKIRFLVNLFYWGAMFALLIVFFLFLFPKLLPFAIGFAVASVWNPVVTKIAESRRRWFASAVIIVPFWCVILFLLWRLGMLAYSEAGQLLKWIQNADFTVLLDSIRWTAEDPSLKEWILERLESFLPSVLTFSQTVLSGLIDLLLALPGAFLFCFVMIVSSLLLSISYPKIEPFLLRQLPARFQTEYYDIKEFLIQKILRILRAYGILFLVNYAEIFLGLWLIRIPYPLLIAAVVALFDLLPFIGTATILVPWGLIDLIFLARPYEGIGLIILAVVVSLVREVLQPKIVGKHIGLSALSTLFSIYLGMKFLGVFGVFLFPLLFLFLKEWNEAGRISLWKNDPDRSS